jgi:LuxR family quorum-sensing system transcriptional regulator CciR
VRPIGDRFAEAAEASTDLVELGAALSDATLELGFHHFALLDHASLCTGAGLVRIDNYPQAWASEIVEFGYAGDDPVHLASRRSAIGFSWRELGTLVRLDRRQKAILSRSRHHGLGEGFTVPANIQGEPSASCSFVVRRGFELPEARLNSAQLVGVHALRAARRLRPAGVAARPRLSRREVECLRLVAQGKTDWEIARILGISTHTARQYLKRARAAYDAVSRSQLVVYALRDSWIAFEDAIPPFGRMG